MKKVLLTTIAVLTAGFIFAQSEKGKPSFNAGIELGLPVGDFGDVYSIGIGASVQAELPVAESLLATGSVGYSSFSPKSDFKDFIDAAGFIPVKVGAKYFFANNFYGAAQVGASIGTADGSETTFAWTPGIGMIFNKIDAGIRYESWTKDGASLDQIGLRVAYKF